MTFLDALWTDADPLYAPCANWSGKWQYWKAPAKYRNLGYSAKPIRLPGVKGDGLDLERAARARELTRDMLKAMSATETSAGTWGWLFEKYRNDPYSPYQDVKSNTQENYDWCLKQWEPIESELLTTANYEKIIGWKHRMNDRSAAYVKRMFTMLRIVTNYGAMIEIAECQRISEILKRMRIKTPKARTQAPTKTQIEGIIRAAESAADGMFALGLSLQWWFHLRAVDVRGQYLASDGRTGIIRNGKRWADGLEWSMLDREFTVIRKVPSKTEDRMTQDIELDLTLVPEIQQMLRRIPMEQRVGPVIKNKAGLPYTMREWSSMFRKYARETGVPDDVWMMDTRAAAITDGKNRGASRTMLAHAANHRDERTTDRYMRGRGDDLNKVVEMRRQ